MCVFYHISFNDNFIVGSYMTLSEQWDTAENDEQKLKNLIRTQKSKHSHLIKGPGPRNTVSCKCLLSIYKL